MKDLYALFIHELKNIYATETQILHALPALIEGAKSEKLKEAFRQDIKEVNNQIKRLKEIGIELNQKFSRSSSPVITVLLEECDNILQADYNEDVRDAALIDAAQKIEHYEICCYGTLKAYAKHFKLEQVLHLLEESSKEEGKSNKNLGSIAEGTVFTSGVNGAAYKKSA